MILRFTLLHMTGIRGSAIRSADEREQLAVKLCSLSPAHRERFDGLGFKDDIHNDGIQTASPELLSRQTRILAS